MYPSPSKEFSDWDVLLDFIEERRVIPIIGSDLVRLNVDGESTTFDHYLADRLAGRLGLPAGAKEERLPLNDVVCRYVSSGRGARQDLYPKIRAILREAPFAPPQSLRQLAEISHFDLFVTTTVDSLMEKALNEVRFGGQQVADVFVYKAKGGQDLRRPKEQLNRATIYYLFGRASTVPDYVICDEDMLEFLQSLQQEKFRPPLLFDAFRDNHLLLIGLHFADWLARFFLRVAKPGRLSDPRDVLEIVADRDMNRDHDLVLFLQHFSSRTQIFSGESGAFVDELWRRWRARNPDAIVNPAKPRIPPAEVMPEGAIFISYAREDLEAVRELKSGLDAEGLTVWFDMDRLGAGDAWDDKIRRNIQACSLFIAVISVNTENREEGYFRREWRHAVDRSWNMADDRPFIVPVIVDETARPRRIPERFEDAHMTRLPGGRVTGDFVRRLRESTPPG
ncbi:MAG: toll/interleukin-1 receptor domain-containing protein [Opitutaceae bacterium]